MSTNLKPAQHIVCIGLYNEDNIGLCVHDDFGNLVPLVMTDMFVACMSFLASSVTGY